LNGDGGGGGPGGGVGAGVFSHPTVAHTDTAKRIVRRFMGRLLEEPRVRTGTAVVTVNQ
jgi:hypothetical protein